MVTALISLITLLLVSAILFILQKQLKQQRQWLEQQLSQQTTQMQGLDKQWHEDQAKTRENLMQAQTKTEQGITERINQFNLQLQRDFAALKEQLKSDFHQHRTEFDKHQLHVMKQLQENMQQNLSQVRQQLNEILQQNNQHLTTQLEKLTQVVNERLKEISGQVEKRLSEGFEKTTATFSDVIKRLALIDEAQKKITELSGNVVSLQEVLVDRKARGAFGEVQLSALIQNLLPEANYAFQHTFSNQKRPDCVLFLPEPTGTVAIDAKFPLENYRLMNDSKLDSNERKISQQNFRQDIKHHLTEISQKYIIPGETSDGAVMFIPAEAVFAEIHAKFPDIVEESHRMRVWMVSPTTMMAILTTARAVLKDAATRKQVNVIQEHLSHLAKDFDRFQKRMDTLSRHVEQTHEDVKQVNISARKISTRFQRIEQVELEDKETTALTAALPTE